MTKVHEENGYLFYVGIEYMENGHSRTIWNIVPAPKTIEEKRAFCDPSSGYPNRTYIERVKGVKFPDRYLPILHGTQETYLFNTWSGR